MSREHEPARVSAVTGKAPAAVRRVSARLARKVRSGRPVVTAVVLLHGEKRLARAALDAVRDQPLARLRIVPVVMDERLRPLAAAAAAEDWRVRPMAVERNDVTLARQLGSVRAARSPWLMFVSPGQVLLPGAIAALLEARDADSRVVLGGLEGPAHGWAHTPLLGRLLIPRHLWGKTLDDADPDGQTAAISLLVDGFTETGCSTLRDDVTPRPGLFEKAANPMRALSVRVAADRSMLATLESDNLPEARAERAAGALVRDLPRFLLGVEHASSTDWTRLQSHTAELVGAAGEDWWDAVPVEDRVAAWLAARDRRDALTTFVTARRFAEGRLETEVDQVDQGDQGDLLARMEAVPEDVPAPLLRLGRAESGLRAQVRRMRLDGDDVLVELYAGLRRVDQGGRVPEVSARLTGPGSALDLPVEMSADAAVTRWMNEPHQYHDYGVVTVRIPLAALTPGAWRIGLDMQHDGVRRQGEPAELAGNGSAARHLEVGSLALRWHRSTTGVELVVSGERPVVPADGVVVRRFEAAPGELAVELDAPVGATASLVAPGQTVTGSREGDRWVFELTTDPWGLGAAPAPTGSYRLRVASRAGDELSVSLSEAVTDLLPHVALDEVNRTTVGRGPDGGLALRLDPPLDDEEAGTWAQHLLQQAYRKVQEPVDPRLVYFQSFGGQSPTDHPGAIQAELHRALTQRSATGTRTLWGVADSSVRVPEGAEPVLLRSRGWYDALARSAFIVTNIELEPWFERRADQQVLETYHGYPSKAMGLAQWRARGMTPSHLQQMLRRTSGSWNNLLTPIPEMDRFYRENYEFDGRIIAQGYPRDDALVATDRDARRARVRELLGIAPHQHVVLYAPTWRDDLATNFRSARSELHLDVEQAAAALGPDYVILLRGHRFHAAAGGAAHVLDVTGYPEINDLILAADVAVLDYTSLRFDFALTGRPMVFLVPDLEHYTEQTRGFLYSFEGSAPGPFVETTEQVVAALQDLPALTRTWAPRIAQVNAHFNALADGRAAERVVAEFFAPLLG